MFRILTVCTGNICRSPMAAYLLRQAVQDAGISDVDITSAATSDWETGNPIDPRAAALLTRRGIETSSHVARQFDAGDFDEVDLVLALDADHYTHLRRLATSDSARTKIRMLRSFDPDSAQEAPARQGIYDPWYGDDADFETTYQLISAALPGLVQHIRNQTADTRGA
ncbi:low molecular weight protein-tyrosine-phosphatase [Arthrobacter sp. JSM 101049]|uniref:low molecular weight protein-tyrosine-phosphatase n=1 Tax=Arthrobacter sp. JSM 101049 TaxID=929097 RepID=UPI0035652373